MQLGPANDLFFLNFDQFGSAVNAFVDPPGVAQAPVPNNTLLQADYGVMSFERFNNALSLITGVVLTDPVVQPVYQASQQAMPAGPQIDAFVSSQQTAMSALANSYCAEMLASQTLTNNFFGGGFYSNLGLSSSSYFGASGSSARTQLENTLATNALGSTTVAPAAYQAIVGEVDALITRVPQIMAAQTPPTTATVLQTTVAACRANRAHTASATAVPARSIRVSPGVPAAIAAASARLICSTVRI